jgi:hypothetical protein
MRTSTARDVFFTTVFAAIINLAAAELDLASALNRVWLLGR